MQILLVEDILVEMNLNFHGNILELLIFKHISKEKNNNNNNHNEILKLCNEKNNNNINHKQVLY